MPVNPPSWAVMLVRVARSSTVMASTRGPANSNTLPSPAPALILGSASRVSAMSSAVTPGGNVPFRWTSRLSGTVRAHEAGHHAVRHVRRTGAEGQAPDRAAVRRVRVGADEHLARQGVLLDEDGVADSFGPLVIGEVAVVDQAVVVPELLVAARHGLGRREAVPG